MSKGIPGADSLLDPKMSFRFDGKSVAWQWALSADTRRWVEENKEVAREYIMPLAKGWKVKYVNA